MSGSRSPSQGAERTALRAVVWLRDRARGATGRPRRFPKSALPGDKGPTRHGRRTGKLGARGPRRRGCGHGKLLARGSGGAAAPGRACGAESDGCRDRPGGSHGGRETRCGAGAGGAAANWNAKRSHGGVEQRQPRRQQGRARVFKPALLGAAAAHLALRFGVTASEEERALTGVSLPRAWGGASDDDRQKNGDAQG